MVANAPRDLLLDKLEVDRIFRIENIYYDFDKYNIRADAKPELDKLVRIMNENAIRVELGSHTDCRGSFTYNERLAQNRAESVVRYLTESGIDADRLIPKGYGEYKLINRCSDGVKCSDEEHQANRRTEFKILDYMDITNEKDFFNADLFKEGDVIDLYLLPSGFFYECLFSTTVNSGNAGAMPKTQSTSNRAVEPQKQQVMLNRDLVANTGDKYTVQIGTGTVNPEMLGNLEGVHSFRGNDGISRYFIGEFARREDAVQLLNQMVARGFKDSWIAPLDQNRQVK
jgi:hypothetical protein